MKTQFPQGGRADYVFYNGVVATVNPEDEVVSGLAVAGNRILAAGPDEEMLALAGEGTRMIDLGGRTLTPGIIDAHAHIAVGGVTKNVFADVSPDKAPDLPSLLAIVKETASRTKPGDWVVCWGYDEMRMKEKKAPSALQLDQVCPDNPLLVGRCDIHTGAFNTRGYRLCGMSPESCANYNGSEAERHPDGTLYGVFRDNAYYKMLNDVEIPAAAFVAGLAGQSVDYARVGVTSVHDAGGFGAPTNSGFRIASDSGRFKLRALPMFFSFLGQAHYVSANRCWAELGIGSYAGNDKLKYGLAKFMLDGASSTPSAAMLEPFSHTEDDYGTLSLNTEDIEELVLALHRSGCQVTAHAVGDRAIEMWLDLIEKAQTLYPRPDPRHRIEHCCITNDAQIKRIKELGMIPVANPRFVHLNGDRYITFYGDRIDRIFPLKSFLAAGVPCAIGTDSPIISENPLEGIATAMSRKASSGNVIAGSQRVTFLEILRMYTYNGAYAAFEESRTGSLEPGKLADLAVFDGNLLESMPEDIEKTNCVFTMVDGEILHDIL